MVLRVRLVDGHGQLGAAADQALAALQQRVVHGAGVEAFGGEQLERAVLALEVDGAHLGHHQAGDLAHDLVEPGLAVGRLGHDLPQPAHDDAQRRLGGRDPCLPPFFCITDAALSGRGNAHAVRSRTAPSAGVFAALAIAIRTGALARPAATHEISLCPARTGHAAYAPPARHRPHRSAR